MKNVIILLCVLLALVVLGSPLAIAAWDYKEPPATAENIIDGVVPLPRMISDKFGTSDRTVVFYNLTLLREVLVKQDKTIKTMEVRIKALEALVLPKPEPKAEVVK